MLTVSLIPLICLSFALALACYSFGWWWRGKHEANCRLVRQNADIARWAWVRSHWHLDDGK